MHTVVQEIQAGNKKGAAKIINTINNSYAIIWDMDGVLIDSADLHYRAWRETVQSVLHTDMSLHDFRRTFGLRNEEMLRDYLGYALPSGDVIRLADRKEALYRELIHTEGLTLLPGVWSWLNQAQATGWIQAVASSAPRLNVEAVLDALQIRRYFGTTISAEDVKNGKPDPEVFITAADKLAVPPARCIVIEDAPFGILGARRAGMACIGVLTTHQDLSADITADRLDALAFCRATDLVARKDNIR